ncbi:hypothetical protein [Niveispirillum sp.]|uniref:hypothetical protein n=1 Tax=Niveispirillum sp. TaxID=1917217 RepID=UPI001B42D879|nr:hypothetical protein [Niveispirillum sp.]MBP7336911.1 hypothetical protein [Niveispirillum sp.]
MTHTAEELAQALSIATKIDRKVKDLLSPIEREMRLMGYRQEFQEIIWQAIADEATRRATECRKG